MSDATEISKPVFDFIISQQLNNLRHSNQVVADIISLLNKADADILAKIAERADQGTFTAKRLNALLSEIRKINAESYAGAKDNLSASMMDFGEHISDSTTAMIATQAPIAYNAVRVTQTQLEAIVDKTPITVGPEKKLLLEEVFSSLAAGKEEDIRGAIRLGMVEGESGPEIVRRLRGTKANQFKDGALGASRRDCEAMVRTVVNSTGNQAMQAVYKANAEVVKGWVYLSTLDSRTTVQCRALSGSKWPIGEGPIPPLHVRCRSIAAPDLKTWRELGVDLDEMPVSYRSSIDGPVRADITMQEWMMGKKRSEIVDMLGPSRAKLFLDGKLDIQKFATSKGEVYTLKQLKERNQAAFKAAFGE